MSSLSPEIDKIFQDAYDNVVVPTPTWVGFNPETSKINTEKTPAELIEDDFNAKKAIIERQLSILHHEYDALVDDGKFEEATENLQQQQMLYHQLKGDIQEAANAYLALGYGVDSIEVLSMTDEFLAADASVRDLRKDIADLLAEAGAAEKERQTALADYWASEYDLAEATNALTETKVGLLRNQQEALHQANEELRATKEYQEALRQAQEDATRLTEEQVALLEEAAGNSKKYMTIEAAIASLIEQESSAEKNRQSALSSYWSSKYDLASLTDAPLEEQIGYLRNQQAILHQRNEELRASVEYQEAARQAEEDATLLTEEQIALLAEAVSNSKEYMEIDERIVGLIKDATSAEKNRQDALAGYWSSEHDLAEAMDAPLEEQLDLLSRKQDALHRANEELRMTDEYQEALRQSEEDASRLTEDQVALLAEARERSQEWLEIEEAKVDAVAAYYDKLRESHSNAIDLNEIWLNDAIKQNDWAGVTKYSSEVIAHYREMQEELHAEAEYYRSRGYSDTSEEVSALSKLWIEYRDAIANYAQEAYLKIVDNFTQALDTIQSVYDKLHEAADEYATNGFITQDTYQELLALGPEYLAFLRDENGELSINEEAIRGVIAARTEQLGIESALAYVEQIRLAKESGNTQELNRLLTATEEAADATWGLVYASIAQIGLSEQQHQAALENINTIRALADSAVSGIGQTTGSVTDELSKMKSGLGDVLKYVMEMLKQRTQDQIDLLRDAKDAYSEIISQRKESLRLAEKEKSHQKTIADKTKEMAKLQAQYDIQRLDTSRDSQAKQAKLLEQMAKLQQEIDDEASSYSISMQEDALDAMQKAYEDEKDSEIKELNDSISSTEKLYRKAMDYLENEIGGDYERLKNEIVQWNYDAGNSLESSLVEAWDNALSAFEKYQSAVEAYHAYDAGTFESYISGSGTTVGKTVYNNDYSLNEAVRANEIQAGNASNGVVASDSTLSKIHSIVARMKNNSAAWADADDETRLDLAEDNRYIASVELPRYGVKADRHTDGNWYITSDTLDPENVGELLYEKYHTGTPNAGGHPTRKQNELFAVLEDDEMVLDREQQDVASKLSEYVHRTPSLIVDFMERMKQSMTPTTFGTVGSIDKFNPALAGIEPGNVSINIGDTIINGGNEDTVKQHIEVTERFRDEIFKGFSLRR